MVVEMHIQTPTNPETDSHYQIGSMCTVGALKKVGVGPACPGHVSPSVRTSLQFGDAGAVMTGLGGRGRQGPF